MSICCSSDDYMDLSEGLNAESHSSPNSSIESQEAFLSESYKQNNMLTNGGLEEWTSLWIPEMPKKWSLPSNEYVKCNNRVVYEGNFSAKMQSEEKGNTARLEQKVQVTPHAKIRICFRYYVEQWKAKGARVYCYFRTREAEASSIPADDLEVFYGKDTFYIIRGGGYGLTYLPHELKIWHTFDETIEIPPMATYLAFGINSYYGTTIYVDDCWITDVTENVTTGINHVTM